MCGFIGRIVVDQTRVGGDLADALPYLRRRGPDSCAMWRSTEQAVELLHTRLAIVDPDARATQPFEDKELGVVVVFNGEIYNYPELRRELAAYPFRTTSDTEVILAAYALRGLAGLNLLRGMYGMALVDTRARRVYVARDPVGKKPVFLARLGGAVSFGSSVLALLAAQGQMAEINTEAVEFFWHESFVRSDQCIVRGISPVLPGQIVELDWQGVELGRHTHAPAIRKVYAGEPFGEVVRNTGQLLESAVERRLRDNPQPTVLCSGGIDSTVITKIAVQMARKGGLTAPLKILTLGALVPLTNDEFYARYAVSKLGERVQIVRPSHRRLSHQVRDLVSLQDEPLGMISFYPMARLVAEVSGISRVLLSGDGGDEVFLGYGRAEMWVRPSEDGEGSPAGHVNSGPPLPEWISRWGSRMVTDDLVGHGFAKVDRASAEQGVEVRCPLVDWDLMAYIRSVPPELLTQGGVMKALLKRQLAGWPKWFLERRKMGFVMNLRWLWAMSGYDGLRDLILPEAQALFGQWLSPRLRRPVADWTRRDIFRHFPEAWRLFVWSEFVRRWRASAVSPR